MKDRCKYTSERECRLIERMACDLETGNHLLRDREDDYWSMWNLMIVARKAEEVGTANEKQLEMCEYERQCRDYSYWNRLPEDKKLFVDEEG